MWEWLTSATPVEWLTAIFVGTFAIAKLLLAVGGLIERARARSGPPSVVMVPPDPPVTMETIRRLEALINSKASCSDVLDEAAVLKLLEDNRHTLRDEFDVKFGRCVSAELYKRDREEVFRRLGVLERMRGLAGT